MNWKELKCDGLIIIGMNENFWSFDDRRRNFLFAINRNIITKYNTGIVESIINKKYKGIIN